MFLKPCQKACREYPCRQEGQDKAERIYSDQQESLCPGLRAPGHQEHAGQCRTHTRSPGEAESKAHDQRRHRRHCHLLQPERKPVLRTEDFRAPEDAQLVQPEQDDKHSSDAGEEHPVVIEEAARRRRAHPQYEERSADPERKKQYADKQLQAFSLPRPGRTCPRVSGLDGAAARPHVQPACQVPEVQRHQRQHTGRKEA